MDHERLGGVALPTVYEDLVARGRELLYSAMEADLEALLGLDLREPILEVFSEEVGGDKNHAECDAERQ